MDSPLCLGRPRSAVSGASLGGCGSGDWASRAWPCSRGMRHTHSCFFAELVARTMAVRIFSKMVVVGDDVSVSDCLTRMLRPLFYLYCGFFAPRSITWRIFGWTASGRLGCFVHSTVSPVTNKIIFKQTRGVSSSLCSQFVMLFLRSGSGMQ